MTRTSPLRRPGALAISLALAALGLLGLAIASDGPPTVTDVLPPCVDGRIIATQSHASYVSPEIQCNLTFQGVTDVNLTGPRRFDYALAVQDSTDVTIANLFVIAPAPALTLSGTNLTAIGVRSMLRYAPVPDEYVVLIDGSAIRLIDSRVEMSPWAIQIGRVSSPLPTMGVALLNVVLRNEVCPPPTFNGMVAPVNVQGALLQLVTINSSCPPIYDILAESGVVTGDIPLREDTFRQPTFEIATASEVFRVEWVLTVETVPGAHIAIVAGATVNWTGTADVTGTWTGLVTQQYVGSEMWTPLMLQVTKSGYGPAHVAYNFPSTATNSTPGRVNTTIAVPLTLLPLRPRCRPKCELADAAADWFHA